MDAGKQQRGSHYKQELDRGLHVLGNVMITISGVAPTAGVFIMAPIALWISGTGAFLAFIIAGVVIGIGMAFSYAEAGTAFPVTGGEWAIVARILGKPLGFVALVLMMVSVIVIPSSIALGAGQYLAVIWPGQNPQLVGAVIMLIVGGLAVLQIKTNAIMQGVLLAIELIAVVGITILGFTHVNQSPKVLVSPVMFDGDTSVAVAFGVILTAVPIAMFALNGYGGAIVFSEETHGARRNIARAILWVLAITIVVEVVPVTAAILGAPSLPDFLSSDTPMSYILTELGGSTVNTVMSLLVFVAIFNGCLAIVVLMSRILYGSGRDQIWPEPISSWLAKVHPKYKTPWVAALVMAVIGAVLTASSDVAVVITFTGVVLVFTYILIALSAIVVRIRFKDLPDHYQMPLWPIWPIIALVGVCYALSQQGMKDILIVLGFCAVALVYYYAYLRPRAGKKWLMLDVVEEGAEDAPSGGA